MSADHVIWGTNPGTKYCGLGTLCDVPDQYEIKRGISRADGFPKDANFKMNKRYPKQVALSDSLQNMETMVVVSTALKDFIEARAPQSLEILPVRVFNHKDRDVGEPFWILSPLAIVDCIDQGASKVVFSALNPLQICSFEHLILDPTRIPADLLMFRLKFFEGRVLLRRELADAIEAQSFTGIRFIEIDEFMG